MDIEISSAATTGTHETESIGNDRQGDDFPSFDFQISRGVQNRLLAADKGDTLLFDEDLERVLLSPNTQQACYISELDGAIEENPPMSKVIAALCDQGVLRKYGDDPETNSFVVERNIECSDLYSSRRESL